MTSEVEGAGTSVPALYLTPLWITGPTSYERARIIANHYVPFYSEKPPRNVKLQVYRSHRGWFVACYDLADWNKHYGIGQSSETRP